MKANIQAAQDSQPVSRILLDTRADSSNPVIMGAIISLFQYYTTTLSAAGENLSEKWDPNAALARELRGQVIHVDATKSFQQWPKGARHPEYKRLQREADRILEL